MNNAEQQFLNELDNKFWKAADKLRANMDAANYKHVVLGLIFLKYVSDAFEARQQELITLFRDVGNPRLKEWVIYFFCINWVMQINTKNH